MIFERTNGIAAQPHGGAKNATSPGCILLPETDLGWALQRFLPVRRNSLRPLFTALTALALAVGLVGCGGGAGAVTLKTGTPTAIAFSSSRALDGSDTVNTDQPNGLLPVFNIWTINSDGSGLTRLHSFRDRRTAPTAPIRSGRPTAPRSSTFRPRAGWQRRGGRGTEPLGVECGRLGCYSCHSVDRICPLLWSGMVAGRHDDRLLLLAWARRQQHQRRRRESDG